MSPKNFLAGLGGAIVLNLLHESLKKSKIDSPRIDLVGEEAVQKIAGLFGNKIKDEQTLYNTTLAGDIISNAAYYSMIGNSPNQLFGKAISLGLVAGIGAVTVPEQIGLDDKPVAKNTQVKAMTVGYYVAGALVTAGILKLLSK